MKDPSEPETIEFILSPTFADSFFARKQDPLLPEFGTATHTGLVRSENQDHYAVIERSRSQVVLDTNMPREDLPDLVEKAYLLVVADGMGGRAFGKLASRLAIRTAWELAGEASNWIMRFTDVDSLEVRKRLDAYSQRVQKEFQERQLENPAYDRMGTTWTSAYLVDRHMLIAHLGDSRAYLWNGKALRKLTRDQTLAQDYIDSGIPAEFVEQYRHILTNCFAANDSEANFDFYHVPIQSGHVLLLCTDGLTEMVADNEIQAAIESGEGSQTICNSLVQLALERGGRDNVTLIAARFHSGNTEESRG